MKVSSRNIGAHLLDWSEGRLAPEKQKHVTHFLKHNPQLGLKGAEPLPYLTDISNLVYANKDDLRYRYMEQRADQDETLAIALLQDDLSDEALDRANQKIKDSAYLKSLVEDYKKTILSPDDTIAFYDLRVLKQKTVRTRLAPLLWILVILGAAALVFFYYPKIKQWFDAFSKGPTPTYEPRTGIPFSVKTVSLAYQNNNESSIFLSLVPTNPLDSQLQAYSNPEYFNPQRIGEPTKKKAPEPRVEEPSPAPVKKKTVRKRRKRKPTPVVAEKKTVDTLPSTTYVVAPSDSFTPQFLPVSDSTVPTTPPPDAMVYPINQSLRNNMLDVFDFFGGKKVKYRKKPDGSYKLEMDLPYIKVDRTLSE